MKKSAALLFSLFSLNVFGQSDSLIEQSSEDSTKLFRIVERVPVFLNGGVEGIKKIISDSLKYPLSAIKDNIGGIVKVRFTIDTTGSITNIEIIQSIREDIDNEAIRLIGLLDGWKPGTQNDKKVKVVYSMPLSFWPNEKFKRKYFKSKAKESR